MKGVAFKQYIIVWEYAISLLEMSCFLQPTLQLDRGTEAVLHKLKTGEEYQAIAILHS